MVRHQSPTSILFKLFLLIYSRDLQEASQYSESCYRLPVLWGYLKMKSKKSLVIVASILISTSCSKSKSKSGSAEASTVTNVSTTVFQDESEKTITITTGTFVGTEVVVRSGAIPAGSTLNLIEAPAPAETDTLVAMTPTLSVKIIDALGNEVIAQKDIEISVPVNNRAFAEKFITNAKDVLAAKTALRGEDAATESDLVLTTQMTVPVVDCPDDAGLQLGDIVPPAYAGSEGAVLYESLLAGNDSVPSSSLKATGEKIALSTDRILNVRDMATLVNDLESDGIKLLESCNDAANQNDHKNYYDIATNRNYVRTRGGDIALMAKKFGSLDKQQACSDYLRFDSDKIFAAKCTDVESTIVRDCRRKAWNLTEVDYFGGTWVKSEFGPQGPSRLRVYQCITGGYSGLIPQNLYKLDRAYVCEEMLTNTHIQNDASISS